MNKIDVVDTKGAKVGDVALDPAIVSLQISPHALWESVRMHLAGLRSGNHSTKRRSEVRGGGRKPYAQKGTGRARQGSIRAPHFVGGGGVFTPKPRDYSYAIPKKMGKAALRFALASKLNSGSVVVSDQLFTLSGKTKELVSVLSTCGLNSALFVLADHNEAFLRAARNVSGIKIVGVSEVCVYDILKYQKMVLSREAFALLQASLIAG